MRQKTIHKDKIVKPIRKQEKEKVFNPSKYRGIYKDLRVDLEEEIKKLRVEWTRERRGI